MLISRLLGLTLVSLVTSLLASHATAGFITYTDRATWEAAVGSFATQDFNSIVTDTNFGGSSIDFGDIRLDGVTNGGTEALIDLPLYQFSPGPADIDGTARVNAGGLDAGESINIIFSSLVSAAGFDTVNYDNSSTADFLQIFVNGVLLGDFPEFDDTTGFFGIVGTDGMLVSEISVAHRAGNGGTFNAFDNVSYAVPAPSPLILMGLGLLGLGLSRRSKA